MNKKVSFFCTVLLATMISKAQTQAPYGTCGSKAPSQQWEAWFSSEVEKFKQNYKNNPQARLVNYEVPVVVHVVHAGEAVGTFPNIDSNQVKSQIIVMNDDFNANGFNIGNTPASFTPVIANTGIKFCRAFTNPSGVALTEIGIDRVNAVGNGWTDLTTPNLDIQNYFNTVIIPATIWDPTKFLNIWVSTRPATSTLNGFATYPAGTSLTGLYGGGSNIATVSNDGIWVYGKSFGTTGTVSGPYDKGRTTTHELGHWLGLRHTWGDGNCFTDYCGDTPASKGPNYGPVTSTPADQCGSNQAPYGEMVMNFMDMTNDDKKYMFTQDQNIRIQTAMSQSSQRNILGTHSLCTATPVPASTSSAQASFTVGGTQCYGAPFTPFNTSSGYPYPTYVWSSAPAASFSPATTVANPAITFNNPGTYTLTLVATNSLNSSSYSFAVTTVFTCTPHSPCLDTLRMIKKADTLKTHYAPSSTFSAGCSIGYKGYLVGTNCYKDKEFAQYFPPSVYSGVPNPQVNSVFVFFDSIGTKAANIGTQIKCKVYGGTVGNGPGAVVQFKSDSLGKIIAPNKASTTPYVATPYVTPVHANKLITTKIIAYRFDMPTPAIINAQSGFYVGIEGPHPTLNPNDSINIFTDNRANNSLDSSAWYLHFNTNTWKNYRYNRSSKVHLAIVPLITCSPITNIKELKASLMTNVNLMPNPNNGVFNLIFTLDDTKEIDVVIHNFIGQKISASRLSNVSNNVFEVDLKDQPNGVYFATVSSGNEKVVKKIIITR